ncbi:MAG TPA: DUF87 domain-containing protein [Candidatus Paceibacterota bacterium]|nr:DUF87 domain-containing protein [Candidatus Paceibacterota bacterium]
MADEQNPNQTYIDRQKAFQSLIAPAGLEILQNQIKLGDKYVKTLFVLTYPRYLVPNWFNPVINLGVSLNAAIYFHPVDNSVILKKLRDQSAKVQATIDEQASKGLVRDPVLETAIQDIETLRDSITQGTEKIFKVGIYITLIADSPEALKKAEDVVVNLLEDKLIYLKPAIFQQYEGLESTFPYNLDRLSIHTSLNSSPASTIFPFISSDLTGDSGILYGVNRQNSGLVIFDRFSLENANMIILSKAGGGKSYAAKLDIIRSLILGTEVIVIDPENEYQYLAETFGGSFYKISIGSSEHINPFDLPIIREDETTEEVFRSHVLYLIGLIKLMVGALTPIEESLLDQAIYQTYAARDIYPDSDFTGKEPPLLEDLATILNTITGGEELSAKLYKYIKGTFAGFVNQPTNIAIGNRLIVFNIRDLEEELRPIAMYMTLNYIWNLIRSELKKRILVVDEAWYLMKYDESASFLYGIAKRSRKYYLGITAITQDVEDFLANKYGKPIITNSSLQMLLKQSPAAIDIIAKTFNLTEVEQSILLQSDVGTGLFFVGNQHVPIEIVSSYSEEQVITSDPEAILARKNNANN